MNDDTNIEAIVARTSIGGVSMSSIKSDPDSGHCRTG